MLKTRTVTESQSNSPREIICIHQIGVYSKIKYLCNNLELLLKANEDVCTYRNMVCIHWPRQEKCCIMRCMEFITEHVN